MLSKISKLFFCPSTATFGYKRWTRTHTKNLGNTSQAPSLPYPCANFRAFRSAQRVRNSFLLLCPSFDPQRRDLLAGVSELLQPLAQIDSLSRNVLLQLLLYGDKDFPDYVNKIILQLTIDFIHKTGRLG